jgi:alpha-amylase/alpha-mannosidase (GH57 family)
MNAFHSVVLHGHFYQPPREDPWTGAVPEQPSAAPFHDWNERITHECYESVVTARLPGPDGAPDAHLNTLEWMSFDFGPTLLDWLEPNAPEVYRAILEADRLAAERFDGHGGAVAMPYHHPILPLAAPRDRVTEIRWGIQDFQRRFGRDPEGMWLPETAVDVPTLDAVAAEGIAFTILAPHQVVAPPPSGLPGVVRTPSGREIAVFVYDGPLSHGVAFGGLLRDGVAWAHRMADRESVHAPTLRSIATDGETFGHHHVFSEMALARAIVEMRAMDGVRVENFASFLAREGAHHPVQLVEPSAWSCAHGVDRWTRDCGCAADPGSGRHQRWRAPLRAALEWLAGELHAVFRTEGARYFDNPWEARDARGGGASPSADVRYVDGLTVDDRLRAVELLEMERNALRLFTSCAWFFDDVGRLEPRQVLGYAARAIELSGPVASRLEAEMIRRLEAAESNDPEVGSAARMLDEILERRTTAVGA